MHRIEIVHKAHDGADQNAEAGDSDGFFSLEVEECNDEGDGDATAADTCHCAKGHDEGKRKDSDHLDHRSRKNVFVTAHTGYLCAAYIITLFAVSIDGTRLVTLALSIFVKVFSVADHTFRLLLPQTFLQISVMSANIRRFQLLLIILIHDNVCLLEILCKCLALRIGLFIVIEVEALLRHHDLVTVTL